MQIRLYSSMFIYRFHASLEADNNSILRNNSYSFSAIQSFSSRSIGHGRVSGAHRKFESQPMYGLLESSVSFFSRISYHFYSNGIYSDMFSYMSPSDFLDNELRTFSDVSYSTYLVPQESVCRVITTSNVYNSSRQVTNQYFGYLRPSHLEPTDQCIKNTAHFHSKTSQSSIDEHQRSLTVGERIHMFSNQDISSTIQTKHSETTSFYESCILEINKIAVEGKRVFRNHSSSQKSTSEHRGQFTYIDDLDSDISMFSESCVRRVTNSNRREARRGAHTQWYSFNKVIYRRVFQRLRSTTTLKRNRHSSHQFLYNDESRKYIQYAYMFFHSVLLRDKLALRITNRFPYRTWLVNSGLVDSVDASRIWKTYISFKINSTLYRTLGKYLKCVVPRSSRSNHLLSLFRSYVLSRHNQLPVKLGSIDSVSGAHSNSMVLRIHALYRDICSTSFFDSYVSVIATPVSEYNSTFFFTFYISNLHNMLFHIICCLPHMLISTDAAASLFGFEYQYFDRIFMSICTVFHLSSAHFTDYIGLCDAIKKLIRIHFVSYNRSYVSKVLTSTLLSVPSYLGDEVISNLPLEHREVFRGLTYSTYKTSRYKKKLVMQGVLKIPTLSLDDKFFSLYNLCNIDSRSVIFLNCNSHLFKSNNSNLLYYFFLYYFLFFYSVDGYSFIHKNLAHSISRLILFVNSSALCSNIYFSSTSSNMFSSFLNNMSFLLSDSVRVNSTYIGSSSMKVRYANVKPFFHGSSIVFFCGVSNVLTKLRVVYTSRSSILFNYRQIVPCFFIERRTSLFAWHSLYNTNTVHMDLHSGLRSIDNSFCNRLISQSGTTNAIISSYLYAGRVFQPCVRVYKKARKYFSMSRRRYQSKWYN